MYHHKMEAIGADDVHKPRDYHPTVWGDFFLTHTACTPEEHVSMKEKAETLREEVRRIVTATTDPREMLRLVDALQRLGLGYLYEAEIEKMVQCINGTVLDEDDLYTVALRFYYLRRHGYYVSPDVFLKFKNRDGNFTSSDTKSLLSLYNAAYMRTPGEELLDDAISFTINHLKSAVRDVEPVLAKEVMCSLEAPLFRRVRSMEAIHYIPIYEQEPARNDSILQLAKLDFNLVQVLHCEELREVTRWWNGLGLQKKLTFARDRVAEMHFWMTGMLFEPQYSYARIMVPKMVLFFSIYDDIIDNYSTTEECDQFTRAIERMVEEVADGMPEYLKFSCLKIMSGIKETEEELKLHKNKHFKYLRKVMTDAAKCYNAENKWRDEDYVPESVSEHLNISVGSSLCMHMICLAFIGMGDVVTSEAIEWAFTTPDVVRALCVIGRVSNDIVSREREQETKHVVSTVESCMKEHGVGLKEACKKLRALIEEEWKIISKALLRPTSQPMAVMEKVVDLTRTMDMIYKYVDGYTLSYTIRDKIALLYVKPIPL